MELTTFIENSGESLLLDYRYTKGTLSLYIETDDVESYTVEVTTDFFLFNLPVETSHAYRTFHIELISLSDVLSEQNGIFIPASDFESLMKEKRQNLNLAYGLKSKEAKYLISLKGATILCSVVLRDTVDVHIIKTEE